MVQSTDPGRQIVDCFKFVSEFFRNCDALLLSADSLLQEHGDIVPYNWAAVSLESARIGSSLDWLPYRLMRQYSRRAFKEKEVITIAVVPWNPWDKDETFSTPLCVGSWMAIRTGAGDTPYWGAVMQVWKKRLQPGGAVETVAPSDCFEGDDLRDCEAMLSQKTILSLARPLLDIRSVADLRDMVVRPLLSAVLAKTP
jgi:hypothetical protein